MTPTVTIFYDGRCHLCSREIAIFRRRVTDGRLDYVDISHSDFIASDHGLDADAVHRTMHVKLANGEIRTGVPALAAMWEQVPGFRWMAWLSRVRVLKPVFNLMYALFAWIRPRLPQRATSCETGTCAVSPGHIQQPSISHRDSAIRTP
jgi:predicted DCC family thiol-disulfide oxidoreductase YuxK